MKRAFLLSLWFHLALLGVLLFSAPSPKRMVVADDPYIVVDLVPIGEESTSQAVTPVVPEEKQPQPEAPQPPPPPPPPVEPPPRPVIEEPPQPDPPKDEPVEQPPEPDVPPEPEEAEPPPPPKPPTKKPPQPKKPTTQTAQPAARPANDYEKALADWMGDQKSQTEPTAPAEQPPSNLGGRLSPTLSMTEMDNLKYHVERNWRIASGGVGLDQMTVEVLVKTAADGTVTSVQVRKDPAFAGNSYYQALADSAGRAIRFSSPLPIPRGKEALFASGVTFRFTPGGLSM